MKKKQLLFFIFIPYLFFAQTNLNANYVVITSFVKKLDSGFKTEMSQENPRMEKYIDNAISIFKNSKDRKANFNLIVKDSLSSFVLQPKDENESGINIPFIISKVAGNYFTNLNTGNTINYNEDKGSNFIVSYSKQDVIWNISDEQKKIGKYDCYKATTTSKVPFKGGKIEEKSIEVWFCPSIPVKAGPYQYSGLPGLVILLTDNRFYTIYLQNLELNPKEIAVEKAPKEGIRMTNEEYLQYQLKTL